MCSVAPSTASATHSRSSGRTTSWQRPCASRCASSGRSYSGMVATTSPRRPATTTTTGAADPRGVGRRRTEPLPPPARPPQPPPGARARSPPMAQPLMCPWRGRFRGARARGALQRKEAPRGRLAGRTRRARRCGRRGRVSRGCGRAGASGRGRSCSPPSSPSTRRCRRSWRRCRRWFLEGRPTSGPCGSRRGRVRARSRRWCPRGRGPRPPPPSTSSTSTRTRPGRCSLRRSVSMAPTRGTSSACATPSWPSRS